MDKKQKLIDLIVKESDLTISLFQNEIKKLWDREKITYGSYWYLLNPYKEIFVCYFYGLKFAGKKKSSMISKRNYYKIREFERALEGITKFRRMLEFVISEEEHDLKKCREFCY